MLAYANSCLNPILYALVSDNFRKGFIKVICVAVNKLTFGKCCASHLHCNSRMEVTFYNGSTSNRLSRTNSSHRTATTHVRSRSRTLSNNPSLQQIVTENSSLLLKSPKTGSNPGLAESAPMTEAPTSSIPRRLGKSFPRATSSLANRIQKKPKEHKKAQRVRTFDEVSST